MNQCTSGALSVGAGAAESSQDSILQGAAGNSVTIGADEQRCGRWPGHQSVAGGGASLGGSREADAAVVEIILENAHERRLNGDPSILAALAMDMNHRAVIATSDVADVGAQEFIGAQSGEQRGQYQCAIAPQPVAGSPLGF